MKKALFIATASIWLVVGCAPSIKKGWRNFRAHYNTYYNAEKNFQKGRKKVKKQQVEINPLQPVRIHPAPVQAGKENFQAAIDKGANILQDHPQSKWVDDAVFLIGKSYYYRGELYHALQKFEELQNLSTSVKLQQLAVIWKGRTLLDLNQNSKAISFLQHYLQGYQGKWPARCKAEMQALLGEHLAMLQQWQQSAQWLKKASVHLKDKSLTGRTYFLLGQVLAKQKKLAEAYQAFTEVGNYFSGFMYSFWAQMKRAQVARRQQKLALALSIYNDLLHDDKFFQRRQEVRYQMARTLEIAGQIKEAEADYYKLLHGNSYQNASNLDADIYYRLGKINSDVYKNYTLAAAYFDSSSAASGSQLAPTSLEDAHELARAFGDYTQLQHKVDRADSLLYLGSLKPSALSSVIERARNKYQNQRTQQQREKSRSVGVSNVELEPHKRPAAGSSKFGFLNYRNAELVRQQKAQFRAIWGNRLLVDNWRRSESIRNIAEKSQPAEETSPSVESVNNASENNIILDLNVIPSTSAQTEALKKERVQAEYELGNLTFLRLNMPDSAKHFFYSVVASKEADSLRPKALYSLYQIFSAQNNADSAAHWKSSILEQYPNTIYARQVNHRENDQAGGTSYRKLLAAYHSIIDSSKFYTASKLRRLALKHRSSSLAPHIYYEAIKAYIRQAKLVDSLAAQFIPDFYDYAENRYQSAYWDSVRLGLAEYDTTFAHSSYQEKIDMLKNALKVKQPAAETPTCEQLGITAKMSSGMETFLKTVHYPDKFKGKSFSGTITFSFLLRKQGTIKSYKRVSSQTLPGIQKAFEQAFDGLKFAPFSADVQADQIRCQKTFPISH